jgi:hypothetical protein
MEELGTRESSGIPLAVDVVLSMPFLDVQEILEGRRGVTSENDVYKQNNPRSRLRVEEMGNGEYNGKSQDRSCLLSLSLSL